MQVLKMFAKIILFMIIFVGASLWYRILDPQKKFYKVSWLSGEALADVPGEIVAGDGGGDAGGGAAGGACGNDSCSVF